VSLSPGKKVLSILPIWHAYERSFEYFIFSGGCTQIYTNIRYVKQDLKQFQPQYMVGVPRLWESIYEGVQKQFRDQPPKQQKLVNFFLDQSLAYIRAKRITQGLDLEQHQISAATTASRANWFTKRSGTAWVIRWNFSSAAVALLPIT
jgi:long-chain acyl-CoA synthetase